MTDKTTATMRRTMTTTTMRRRTETTQSSVKLLKEDDDDGNTDVKYENNKDYHKNSNSNSNFFDDWGQGNWCWERDYNKYPVVSFPNYHCHDDDGNNNNDIDIDIDDDEKKPAAIKSSSSISSDRVTTTTASSEMDMTTTKREETRKISIRRRNSQIKVENKNEENHTNDYINSSVNNSNNENNDDSDDSSFYDDWVEGNWCLLDKYDKSNNSGSGDSNNPSRERRHGIRTTRSRKDTRVDNNNSNNDNDNESAKIDLKRSRYDDDEDDEESDCEDNNDDNEQEEEEEEEEFLPEDNNDAGNYRANKRPARKRSRPLKIHQIWMEMFEELVEYKKQHKNTLVPFHYEENPILGRWVHTQSQFYKHDDILPNRLALLNSIDFSWDGARAARDQIKWMNMYQKLVAYKKQHKNTIVPFCYEKNPKLGRWVSKQRQNYRNQELLPKRVHLLKSIGFEWHGSKENHHQLWMGMFQNLVAYKKQHKNTMVPDRYDENPKLGRWVHKQRHFYNRGELLPKRTALLKSIGFEWDGENYDELWMGMFQKLVAYKEMHENCMVPFHYQEDPKLGRWVSSQRLRYKNDSILPKRVDLLKSIDFEWVWIDSVKRKKTSG